MSFQYMKLKAYLSLLKKSHCDLWITRDTNLKFHTHIRKKLNAAKGMVTNVLSCTVKKKSSVTYKYSNLLLNLY